MDKGIMFRIKGIAKTHTSNKTPWITADSLCVAPALALADERTTTEVMGRPPMSELTMLPAPCERNSRLVSVMRRRVSRRSAASMQSRVSIEATMAMVMPVIQT